MVVPTFDLQGREEGRNERALRELGVRFLCLLDDVVVVKGLPLIGTVA